MFISFGLVFEIDCAVEVTLTSTVFSAFKNETDVSCIHYDSV